MSVISCVRLRYLHYVTLHVSDCTRTLSCGMVTYTRTNLDYDRSNIIILDLFAKNSSLWYDNGPIIFWRSPFQVLVTVNTSTCNKASTEIRTRGSYFRVRSWCNVLGAWLCPLSVHHWMNEWNNEWSLFIIKAVLQYTCVTSSSKLKFRET